MISAQSSGTGLGLAIVKKIVDELTWWQDYIHGVKSVGCIYSHATIGWHTVDILLALKHEGFLIVVQQSCLLKQSFPYLDDKTFPHAFPSSKAVSRTSRYCFALFPTPSSPFFGYLIARSYRGIFLCIGTAMGSGAGWLFSPCYHNSGNLEMCGWRNCHPLSQILP